MTDCKRCDELFAILKDVKEMMDSEDYSISFDSIYDRISMVIDDQNK